jgi:hypothetical protein
MSEIRKTVHPSTKSLIWLCPKEAAKSHPHFEEIDYLLDGLLTATFFQTDMKATTILGNNFKENFFVFVSPEIDSKELKSFLELMEKNLNESDEILVVDDRNEMEELNPLIPKAFRSRLRKY